MTNERDDKATDKLVSDSYRELPHETAPERLNNAVLRLANDAAARPRLRLPIPVAWTKPLALAATVALSLAIVLEFSRLPEPAAETATPPVESVSEEFQPKDKNALEDARDQARLRAGSNREALIEPEARVDEPKPELRTDAVPSTPAEAASPADLPQALGVQEIQEAVVATPDAEMPKADADADAPERAAKSARIEPLPEAASDPSVARNRSFSLSMAQEKKQADNTRFCDEELRAHRDDWMACIDALRDGGAVEAAEYEYQQFLLQFPAQ